MTEKEDAPATARRLTRVVRDSEGVVREAYPANNEDQEGFDAFRMRVREALLSSVESREAGLNIERVDRFFKAKGLPVPPAIILYPEDVPMFKKVAIEAGVPSAHLETLGEMQEGGSLLKGKYLSVYDVVVLIRDPREEAINGTIFTEVFLVHEMAHAGGVQDLTYQDEEGDGAALEFDMPATGFAVLTEEGYKAGLYEEGWAEYLAAQYVREELHLPDGILGSGIRQNAPLMVPVHTGDRLPGAYIWHSAEAMGITYRAEAALAGYALELLFKRSPELYELMRASRRDPELVHQIPALMDTIRPGLDKFLRNLLTEARAFAEGLRHIQSILKR